MIADRKQESFKSTVFVKREAVVLPPFSWPDEVPASTSTIQRLRPASEELSVVFTKWTCCASGDHAAKRIFAFGGSPETAFSSPLGRAFSLKDVM